MRQLMEAVQVGPLALKVAIRSGLKLVLEPHLPYPLDWEEDAVPVVEDMLKTPEAVDKAMGSPDEFMRRLLEALKRSPARVKLVIGQLLRVACPALEWVDVEPTVMSELDTNAKVDQAMSEPERFVRKVLSLIALMRYFTVVERPVRMVFPLRSE